MGTVIKTHSILLEAVEKENPETWYAGKKSKKFLPAKFLVFLSVFLCVYVCVNGKCYYLSRLQVCSRKKKKGFVRLDLGSSKSGALCTKNLSFYDGERGITG